MSSDRSFPYSYKLASFIMLLPWFLSIALEEKSFKTSKDFLYDSQGGWSEVADLFCVLPFLYIISFLVLFFDAPDLDTESYEF